MDPASIYAISSTTVKIILSLSRYVDEVRNASNEVQQLSIEVSATHLIIGQLKATLTRPEAVACMDESEWRTTFEPLLVHCYNSLKQIEDVVTKAKVKEKCSSAEQVIKRIKWNFKKDEVERLKKNLGVHKDNLDLMLQVFSRARDHETRSIIKDIQTRIKQMDEARKGIKETFVSVSSPDDPRVQLLMADLRGKEIPDPERLSENDFTSIFTPRELELLCSNMPSSHDYEIMARFGSSKIFLLKAYKSAEYNQGPKSPFHFNIAGDTIRLILKRTDRNLELHPEFVDSAKISYERQDQSGGVLGPRDLTYSQCQRASSHTVSIMGQGIAVEVWNSMGIRHSHLTLTFASAKDADEFEHIVHALTRIYRHVWDLMVLARAKVDAAIDTGSLNSFRESVLSAVYNPDGPRLGFGAGSCIIL